MLTEEMKADIAQAGAALTYYCHKASYDAGWWYAKRDNGKQGDIRDELIRNPDSTAHARLGKAFVAEKLMLIVSEVGEAMEGYRKNKMDDHLTHRRSIEVELADALIRIADLAGALQMDLGGAIAEKMAYNAVRPDHKAGARAAEGGKAF